MVEKKRTTKGTTGKSAGFSDFEKAAMKERARELRAEASKADGEKTLLAAIAKMGATDKAMAKRVHAIVKAAAPDLSPKTWYGMPAYARDGDVVCFFQAADKFKARYSTLGFTDKAHLDDGTMWSTSFALKKLSASEEAKITALVKKAMR